MTDDKAGQVQSELSAGGTKRDVENTPKCTRPNCLLTRRLSKGPPTLGGKGSSKPRRKSVILAGNFYAPIYAFYAEDKRSRNDETEKSLAGECGIMEAYNNK